MASTEIQRDERKRTRSKLARYFVNRVASELLNHPAFHRYNDYYVSDFPSGEKEAVPTADQLKAVRRGMGGWTIDLIGAATDQKGYGAGKAAADLLCRFFMASGMVQRLRCEEMERRHRESKAKGHPDYAHIPALWPKHLRFWSTPKIDYDSRLEGVNSLEGVDQEELESVAVEFYRTGIRYSLFEKVIVEALVHRELYATVKCAAQGKISTTLTEQFLRAWSFRKTLSDEPSYSLYLSVGYLLKGLISLGIFGVLTSLAAISYLDRETWKNVSALIALALIGSAVLCRWLVRLIVKWAHPNEKIAATVRLQNNSVFRALNELQTFGTIVGAPAVSLSLARDAALRCYSNRVIFHQIVMAYLDRAIASGEFVWTTHYRPFAFEQDIDDPDSDTDET
ncbi:MAG TPA: hypothetical protein VJQ82_03135 [Terriglobales bacterium]|nr:hypothetical protein [Terriglobales bacterium]